MTIRYTRPEGLSGNPMYTPIVTVGSGTALHFLAGTCAVDEQGNVLGEGDMLVQFRVVMDLLTRKLAAVGAGWSDVVFRTVYTTDMDACRAAQRDPQVLAHYDPDRLPASSLVGVTRLANPAYLVEIELVAATKEKNDA